MVNDVLRNTEQIKNSRVAQPQAPPPQESYYPKDPPQRHHQPYHRSRYPEDDSTLMTGSRYTQYPQGSHFYETTQYMDHYRPGASRQPPMHSYYPQGGQMRPSTGYMGRTERMTGIQYMKELSKPERAQFIKYNVGGLLDAQNRENEERREINLEKEFMDSRKISQFTVQLLGVKYHSDKLTGASMVRIPKKLIITFNFFNFNLFKTKTLTYINVDGQAAVGTSANEQDISMLDRQLVLANEDYMRGAGSQKEAFYTFEVDPVKTGTLETHESFMHYLKEKNLFFDLWDGESLMHFGQAKIPSTSAVNDSDVS